MCVYDRGIFAVCLDEILHNLLCVCTDEIGWLRGGDLNVRAVLDGVHETLIAVPSDRRAGGAFEDHHTGLPIAILDLPLARSLPRLDKVGAYKGDIILPSRSDRFPVK